MQLRKIIPQELQNQKKIYINFIISENNFIERKKIFYAHIECKIFFLKNTIHQYLQMKRE